MLAASFQAKAQYSITFGNKSLCDFEVEIVTCNGAGGGGFVAMNSQQTFYFSDEINYFKVYFAGVPDIARSLPYANCPSIISYHTPNACYVGFNLVGTQTTGFFFDVW